LAQGNYILRYFNLIQLLIDVLNWKTDPIQSNQKHACKYKQQHRKLTIREVFTAAFSFAAIFPGYLATSKFEIDSFQTNRIVSIN
jgi:galactose-1-phosphate uridylyltransferase